ncbi:MAG: GNAT family N-acetyltransferase [Lachnospiraceae bacterium]|nr:GNAT family N-acetyltransferase [Lachnospiraceae bacterium]
MKYYEKMSGKRIFLSPMSEEDAEIYTVWMNDREITDNLGSSTMVFSEEAERGWIEENSGEYQFAIIERESGEIIGNCGIQAVTHTFQRAELGLFIGKEEKRNKGYGKEVLSLLLEYCFDTLNLHNVMLKVFSFNEQAIHTYNRVGFKEIGRRREAYYAKGRFWDEVYMDILKDEFTREFL